MKKTLLVLLIATMSTLFLSGCNAPTKEGSESVVEENTPHSFGSIINGDDLNPEATAIITDYMQTYYRSMAELATEDMTHFFEDPSGVEAAINQNALEVLIEARSMRDVDLTLSDYDYVLDIQNVSSGGTSMEVSILENSSMNFNFMDGKETNIYNIENTFKLVEIEGEYKIISLDKVQDFYVMFTNSYSGGGIAELESLKETYLVELNTQTSNWKEDKLAFEEGTGFEEISTDYPYDGSAAAEYSNSWVAEANIDAWGYYDGNNCQNFASQSMAVSGIPENSEWNTDLTTWTCVPHFQDYIASNSNSGIVGTVDTNLFYGEPGDIIHVGSQAANSHAVIVNDVYFVDGEIQDIIVNSNTLDMSNFPIQAYAYPHISLIKIHGYND